MTNTKPNHSRRKLVQIPHREVLTHFTKPHLQGMRYLRVPMPLELPADVKILACSNNYSYQSIDFIVESESFDEVADCYELPRIQICFQDVQIDLLENMASEIGMDWFSQMCVAQNSLCQLIEKLPASEAQSYVSLLASDINQQMQRVLNAEKNATSK